MTTYSPQTWTNGPVGGTPISAARLQHIEDGLAQTDSQTNSHSIWVPPFLAVSSSGSPSLSNVGSHTAWQFDAASTEEIRFGPFAVPEWWATLAMDLYWSNPVSSTGDVLWAYSYDWTGTDGDDLTLLDVVTTNITPVAAPAIRILKISPVVIGITRDRTLLTFSIRRVGGDAADTLANDASVLGICAKFVT